MANHQALTAPQYPFNHEWHVSINRHHNAVGHGGHAGEWKSWMYEAKTMASEVPRLTMLFQEQRLGTLPAVHQQCSMSAPEAIAGNELTCCLGVKCHECPELLALETMQRVTPEQIDAAKAWTCAAHIVSRGGDKMGEGYVLTKGDRIFWDRVHESLAAGMGGQADG